MIKLALLILLVIAIYRSFVVEAKLKKVQVHYELLDRQISCLIQHAVPEDLQSKILDTLRKKP